MSGPEPGTVWDTYANGSGRHWLEDRLAQLWDYDLTWDYDTVLDTLHGGEDLNIEVTRSPRMRTFICHSLPLIPPMFGTPSCAVN